MSVSLITITALIGVLRDIIQDIFPGLTKKGRDSLYGLLVDVQHTASELSKKIDTDIAKSEASEKKAAKRTRAKNGS